MTSHAFSLAGTEEEVLLDILDRNRRTFVCKCAGVDEAGARAPLGPSRVTLRGLLEHLALGEDLSFTVHSRGAPMPEPWHRVDFDAEPGREWERESDSAAEDSPAELAALWESAVERSRTALAAALTEAASTDCCRTATPRSSRACVAWWST